MQIGVFTFASESMDEGNIMRGAGEEEVVVGLRRRRGGVVYCSRRQR
jgi:hypothetical protein